MINRSNNTTMTRRITLILLSIVVSVVAATAGASIAMATTLKNVSVVTGDHILLKDLFDGVTRNADYVIGNAPNPGEDMVLNARTLYRIAIALDLQWRPKTAADSITVRREATIVPYSSIERALKEELGQNGLSGRYDIALNSGKPSLVLSRDLPQSVEISSMEFDPARDSFNAVLVAPSRDNPIKKISVSGKVERLVSVPVLRSPMRNGMIIGKNDIEMISLPAHELQHSTLFNAEDVIGLTPRRIAHAGKPMMEGELERPQIVDRGETITIFFREGPLMLSAKGKALQSGAKGDLIRVTNLGSSRSVDGVVSGENEVIVQ
ncbi:MAG: flagellar basal body P-ring formation protein FlgA [Alphaproteobacteria bacterium]|nr:flagellar basal body P-ring formation protein FlgA [Alphaproteobacteria bacterium]NCQ87587.1 flagellar basal body P-ring formation protein FlgA [Alphaproteobacteria bacterium]NCT06456.1 flagellar basal body P-ring formation protein FlgA [Alphaproteobacteria bacterium]